MPDFSSLYTLEDRFERFEVHADHTIRDLLCRALFGAGADALTLTVAETVYKGKIRDWGKTKKSLTVIHIPPQLADDLQVWRLECEAKAREAFSKGKRESAALSPDEFIFENEDGGFLDTDNYRKRVLHKIARELKLPKLTSR